MTLRPVNSPRPEDVREPVGRCLALLGAAALLASVLANPWAAGSDAQSNAQATPGTPGITLSQTPTAGDVRIISINGTPQPTPTLPTEPEQGTPVPPATAYNEAGGSATVPESTSGHELRLYRLTIDPQATFDLPESTGWTIVGFSGTVDFYSTVAGSRRDDSFALTAYDEIGSPSAGTFQNLSDAPAIVWVIGVAATDTPDPATLAGVVMERVGQVALQHLTPGAMVSIRYSFAAAGPVARPLDPSVMSPSRRVGDAAGSVPAGIVYGVQGEVTITDATGAGPLTIPAGASVSLDDLTARTITGPAQRATDLANSYILVTARQQSPQPVTTGPPGAPLEPATPIPATPVLTGSPVAGDVVTCDAEPRTVEELQAAIDLVSATPSFFTDPFGRGARSQAGTGTAADDATVTAIESTLAEFGVCTANGDLARAIGLTSNEFTVFLLANLVGDLTGLPVYATPLPVSSGTPTEFVLSDVERFPDGRAGAIVYDANGAAYFTFVQAADGTWLIDAVDQESGQGAIAIDPVATPES